MSDTIIYSRSGHVARLRLNKPEVHNSLGSADMQAIKVCLNEIADDSSVRVLIVTGTGGKTFCAGAALNELSTGEISGDSFQEVTRVLAGLEIPTICAINGNLFGAGVELALSCDFRLGIEGSRLRVPAAALGLCYPVDGIKRFVERLGPNVAKRLLIAAEQFDAAEMLSIGFLDYLVPADQLGEKSEALAQKIAELAPLAVRAMKKIVGATSALSISAEAQQLSKQCLESEDLKEGFIAQREKRQPVFIGR
jgi:enoyl-CoA hydratase/carnithine racemase